MVTVIENLKEAIVGESTAKKKYELFAKKANEENYKEIAHLFEAIAQAESIHIKNHVTSLSKITKSEININDIVKIDEQKLVNIVSNTRNNLIQAIAGETYEFKKMYKSFIKEAKIEDLYVAEYSFDLARKAEIIHSKLFIKYLKLLDKNKKFPSIDIYVCKICGNVELEKPPKNCPICDHDQKFFIKY
jgi:rubrerythrin